MKMLEKPWGRSDISEIYGDHQGRCIGEIWFEHPDDPDFPIMLKILFTSEPLSVQVHPDDKAARSAGLARGKDECWLILGALPDAKVGAGLTRPCSLRKLSRTAQDGSIVDLVDWRTVMADDVIFNPAGTIHALGSGLIILEIQQNIDCTYRLFDYARGRPLDLDKAVSAACRTPLAAQHRCRMQPSETQLLVDSPHFSLMHISGSSMTSATTATTFVTQAGPALLFPFTHGCRIGEEALPMHGAALILDGEQLHLAPDARALLCWPTAAALS